MVKVKPVRVVESFNKDIKGTNTNNDIDSLMAFNIIRKKENNKPFLFPLDKYLNSNGTLNKG